MGPEHMQVCLYIRFFGIASFRRVFYCKNNFVHGVIRLCFGYDFPLFERLVAHRSLLFFLSLIAHCSLLIAFFLCVLAPMRENLMGNTTLTLE
jgi:hypothetical protein